jgi:hypothetical protein
MPITEGGRFSPENTIVSPGVFTREIDLGGVAQGVADIGAAIVAPFPSGPGFSPTLVTSVDELQRKFGIPDGTFYGPYTATEYIKQKGFATVVRVGALTGYNQKHPLVIYATHGRYNRNSSAGALASGSSFVVPSGSAANGYAAGLTFSTSSASTGTVIFNSPTFQFTLQSGAADETANNVNSPSGSSLFSSQVVTFASTASYSSSVYYSGSTSLTTLLTSGILTGSFSNTNIDLRAFGSDPFDKITTLISASYYIDNQSGCQNPVIKIRGVLSGSFGKYNSSFTSDSTLPTLDNCGNLVTGSGFTKILAVINDTQAAGLDSSLNAPGFSGSVLVTSSILDLTSGSILSNYTLNLSSSLGSGYGAYEFSLDKSTNKYITNVFGTDATAGNPATQVVGQKIEAGYLYSIFEDSIAEITANTDSWQVAVAAPIQLASPFTGSIEPLIFTDTYSLQPTKGDSAFSLTNASTPWITSQAVAGVNGSSHRFELFKIHTLSDGTNSNTSFKIEVSNVKLAGTVAGSDWGSFTLSVRSYSDTENRPAYLEQFTNLTLDPSSPNFIARKIGDRYNYITSAGKIIEFGQYSNLSKYIRVEMTTVNYPISAVPYGFEPYIVPIGGLVIDAMTPTVKYTKASTWTNSPGKYASGVVFGETLSVDDELTALYPTSSAGVMVFENNLQYLAPIPANATIGKNVGFALDTDYTSSGVSKSAFLSQSAATINSVPAVYDAENESVYVKMRKFVLGFQGGFDGQSPAIPINTGTNITAGNTQGLNCATSRTAGSVAYNQVIGALSNADEWDINMIVTPGIFREQHSYVTQLVIDMCEQRGDCFYIMDNIVFPASNQSVNKIPDAINSVYTIDSNYVGTYYPWIRILDTNINQLVSVPPSVILPSIFASSDNSSAEWFAVAGLNRGGIPQAVQTLDRLTIADRDALYEARINPIAQFPGEGICVWGQKTLQHKASPTDRINVRRLLISLKKFIASTSKFLVFEQNVSATRNRFLSVVNPYLENVQQRSGLYAFKVVMDDSNNTGDVIDNNQLYGQVYLQASKTSEFVILDFNLMPTGAAFPGA